MRTKSRFIHDFSSCSRTYATLVVTHPSADPKEISRKLKKIPDRTTKVGELLGPNRFSKVAVWAYGTRDKKKISYSRDMRAHVEWLLDRFDSKKRELRSLAKSGYEIHISCLWESTSGNGGPLLDREFMKRLAEFPLDLHFDIWFDLENFFAEELQSQKEEPSNEKA